MSSHSAGKRARRSSERPVDPTGGEVAKAPSAPRAPGGKRRAQPEPRLFRRTTTPASTPATTPATTAAPTPRTAAAPKRAGGRRIAGQQVQPTAADRPARRPGPARLPVGVSLPSVVGSAALAIAVAGALSSAATAPSAVLAAGPQSYSGQANVLNGTTGASISSALENRQQAVSRDSARQALADAAQEDLEAAAEEQAQQRNAALAQLAASAEKHAAQIAQNAWRLPVAAGVYHLTSRFGDCSYLWSHCHTGLDFAAPSGTPITAVANGVVTDQGYSGAYGNRTIVTLEDGTELWYCHQTAYAVGLGARVIGGQLIGYVGSTGNTTGPHLHLEVRPGAGDPVDPYAALVAHGVTP